MKRKVALFALILFLALCSVGGAQESAVYHGNTSSRIFHKQSCRYFGCSKCTAVFNSREDAVKSGYRPCKVCKP